MPSVGCQARDQGIGQSVMDLERIFSIGLKSMNGPDLWSRRGWLQWSQRGLGATAVLALLAQEGLLGKASAMPRIQARPQAKAKRAIQICLVGGLSHLDSFDYKPELERFHGKTLQTEEKPDIFFGQMG